MITNAIYHGLRGGHEEEILKGFIYPMNVLIILVSSRFHTSLQSLTVSGENSRFILSKITVLL